MWYQENKLAEQTFVHSIYIIFENGNVFVAFSLSTFLFGLIIVRQRAAFFQNERYWTLKIYNVKQASSFSTIKITSVRTNFCFTTSQRFQTINCYLISVNELHGEHPPKGKLWSGNEKKEHEHKTNEKVNKLIEIVSTI